jgi:ergothioneine biosynthesis protein EgtB
MKDPLREAPLVAQPARSHCTRAERFKAVRALTRSLAAPLSAEDCAIQSMPDASPAKWHLAHTTWFFETFILARHDPDREAFHPAFRVLFNSYYNAVGDKHPRPQRGLLSRPSLDQVLEYRRHVEDEVAALIEAGTLDDELLALVDLGIQHEQQHQELILTDVKHMLSCNPLRPAYQKTWPLTSIQPREPRWIRVQGGERRIGHEADGFSFDNERPRHTVWVHDFEIASHPVTHGNFIDFIEDGGYRRPELWLSAGWDAAATRGWEAPLYWERRGARWDTFTLRGMAPVERNTPVCHLSFYEADAFARWSGARLPTEAEWEVAAAGVPIEGNFLESDALHPLAAREAAGANELVQMFGDVWEWTRSDYAPYPGFRPAKGAVGEYNGKFMCNQYVLRGGSCATPQSHVRASYRNFFPADARWQFSGVRLARDA